MIKDLIWKEMTDRQQLSVEINALLAILFLLFFFYSTLSRVLQGSFKGPALVAIAT